VRMQKLMLVLLS